ncbi:MAG TPA: NAD(P)H-dependent glycerol-3-phosphate dehydrogenase [Acidobacteriota bacterium]|nr:NAD(P)H-dependent glycerol-3-phosphate dehydrogenase [Acidobacteriota bacterium]HND21823.1 NAD(P)H-dependent glycerol-3-phosphate dehydrogenase [Acidobacteriota bacterium]
MKFAEHIAVIGAGSFGTALALSIARYTPTGRPVRDVRLWSHRGEHAEQMTQERLNATYLPGFTFPDNLTPTSDLAQALDGANIVLTVVPSHVTRETYEKMRPFLKPQMVFVNGTKGIEGDTLKRMSQVISDVLSEDFEPRMVTLSGPSFAQEVAKGDPTAVVAASTTQRWSEYVQAELSNPNFRLYSNLDMVGVEIGAAVKNVIAIAAGAVTGMGFGHNTLVAVITRGLAEITRLAIAQGGRVETLSGLAGVGDLFLTCTGGLSRNRHVGFELGQGRALSDILGEMNSVAEGVKTAKAVYELSQLNNVDMPITRGVYQALYENRKATDALADILGRPLKREF